MRLFMPKIKAIFANAVLCALLVAFIAPPANTQNAGSVEKAANKAHIEAAVNLMKLTKSEQMLQQMLPFFIAQQLQVIKQVRPDFPDKGIKEAQKLMVDAFNKRSKVLLVAVARIYTKHMTIEELKQLAAFYKTDLGKKLIKKMPKIIKESSATGARIGQQIGREIMEDVRKQLKNKGYDL